MIGGMFQSFFLALYRTACQTGLIRLPGARWLFEKAYDIYKRLFEARQVNRLCQFAIPGTTVIDVGANAGFFTLRFSERVGAAGRVIAIEPERENLERLKRAVSNHDSAGVVDIIEAVAAEREGTLRLAVNPFHPGDHRIADKGLPVRAVTIDGLLAGRGWPQVSLIKVDVQGAEHRVLAGAKKILESFHPALFIEVDDGALRRLGGSAEGVLRQIAGHGYTIHLLLSGGLSAALSVAEALSALDRENRYLDFLFLPENSPAAPGRVMSD